MDSNNSNLLEIIDQRTRDIESKLDKAEEHRSIDLAYTWFGIFIGSFSIAIIPLISHEYSGNLVVMVLPFSLISAVSSGLTAYYSLRFAHSKYKFFKRFDKWFNRLKSRL